MGFSRRDASLFQAAGLRRGRRSTSARSPNAGPFHRSRAAARRPAASSASATRAASTSAVEAFGVELTGVDVEREAAATTGKRGSDMGPQARDVGPQRRDGTGRRGVTPQRIDEGVDADHLAASGEQDGEHRALVGAADRAGAGRVRRPARRHRAHGSARHNARTGLRLRATDMRCGAIGLRSACDARSSRWCHGHRPSSSTTGWERDVAVGDTLLRRYLFHHAALDAAFTLAGGGRALDADDVSMADLGRPGGYFNGAVLLAPPADWDDVLGRIGCFFRCGRGQACLWSAWPTPDLRDRRLAALGPSAAAHPSAAVDEPDHIADSSEPDVRSVTTVADLAHWERVAIDGYPLPELHDAPAGALRPAGAARRRAAALLRRPRRRPARRRCRVVRVPRHRLARLRRHAAGGAAARVLAPTRHRTPPRPHPTCG